MSTEITSKSPAGKCKTVRRPIFSDRQIVIRSDGRERLITVSRRSQMTFATLVVALFGWLAYSAVVLVQGDYRIGPPIAGETEGIKYNRLVAQIRAYQENAANVGPVRTGPGSQAQSAAEPDGGADVAKELAQVEQQISTVRVELSQKDVELYRTSTALTEKETELSRIESELSQRDTVVNELLDQQLSLRADLAMTLGELTDIEEERASIEVRAQQLTGYVSALEQELEDVTSRNLTLESGLATLETDIAALGQQRQRAIEEREHLRARVGELEERIASLQRSQQDFLLYLAERTISTIDEAERTIGMTGLGVEMLLDRARRIPLALGGPFVELSSDLLADSELKHEVSVVDSHMERWEQLQFILRALPLNPPLDYYHVTSKYGKRKDPMNGKWAMHDGIDMGAPYRSPVLATSGGVVIEAGWHAGFGRRVVIDHGMGIETVYAHLHSITVKEGDKVGFREQIGLLGSSGRSTGPHVHYEIRVDGNPVDPTDFLEAGRYVFKG